METLLYVILLSFTFILAYSACKHTTHVVVSIQRQKHKKTQSSPYAFLLFRCSFYYIISWYRYFCASFTTKYTLRVLYISSFIPLYFMSFPLLQLYTESEENGKRQQVYNKNDTNRYQTLAFVFRN